VEKPLTDIAFLKALLAAHGIRPRRSGGQHFLVCEDVVSATLKALGAGPEHITELGAGAGVLTQALLGAGFQVRAVERDRHLAKFLKETTPQRLTSSLELVIGDLRHEPWEWDRPYQLVGNIPYYLSGLIIRRITLLEALPRRVVLLVQREVGQRLVSKTPGLQLIGLAVQLWGTAKVLAEVPANCFWPAPRVDSQLLVLEPKGSDRLSSDERERILALAGRFFRARRKQMGGVMRREWKVDSTRAEEALREAGIDPMVRPQEVTVAQWVQLQRTL